MPPSASEYRFGCAHRKGSASTHRKRVSQWDVVTALTSERDDRPLGADGVICTLSPNLRRHRHLLALEPLDCTVLCASNTLMSASLIGRLGSSAFRLST